MALALVLSGACVPTGNAPPYDGGAAPAPSATFRPSLNVMTEPFEDTFDGPDAAEGTWPAFDASATATAKKDGGGDAAAGEGGPEAGDGGLFLRGVDGDTARAMLPGSNLGPNWLPARTNAWRVEDGKLCAQNAHNRGIWLNRVLPVNARIEFDAIAYTDDGDLKAEVWGDGRSFATSTSYTNATSYLVILGGWKNSIHAIARLNEHGNDRKEIRVDKTSDDPREKPVVKGQTYRFRIERTDGKTVRWSVDGVEYLTFADAAPLAGQGHDHFGFNEWEAKVCFDNVKVTPL